MLAEQRLVIVSQRRGHTGRPVEQLGSEQLVAQPTLGLRYHAAQQARVLRSYSQIKSGSASRVLAYGSVYYTRSLGVLGFSAYRGLHSAISSCVYRARFPGPIVQFV